MATSAIRRKPVHTYKSPSFDTTPDQLVSTIPRAISRATPPAPRSESDKSSTDGAIAIVVPQTSSPTRTRYRPPPTLPLYHPLGPLALSLPRLDPSLFGLPNPITVDDTVDDSADPGRRSSSRARRPAAKVRERDGADDEDGSPMAASAQNSARESGPRPPGSPRKRRAAGGGGAKRKRKVDAEDVDGVYPPPAKRTRNPRGTGNATPVVASPLVSEAVAAAVEDGNEPEVDAVPSPEGAETEEASAEQVPVPVSEPKRTRARRARAPVNKRRNSSASASTSTSVSVSIAANTRTTRTTRSRAARERGSSSEHDAEKKEEEEGEGEARGATEDHGQEKPDVTVDEDAARSTSPPNKTIVEGSEAQGAEDKMEVDVLPSTVPKVPSPAPVVTSPPSSAAMSAQAQKEEKEEGELSDEPE